MNQVANVVWIILTVYSSIELFGAVSHSAVKKKKKKKKNFLRNEPLYFTTENTRKPLDKIDIYLHRNQTHKSCHESDLTPALEAKRLPGKHLFDQNNIQNHLKY